MSVTKYQKTKTANGSTIYGFSPHGHTPIELVRMHTLMVWVVALIFVFSVQGQPGSIESATTKIACVGNSITYGAQVSNRQKNAYPAQLQQLLGNTYEVQNFGVNGATLLKKGDRPYWQTEAYTKALQFTPDIVFIKLGTNDSKGQNRIFLNDLEHDCTELIDSFKKRNPKVRIVLLSPLPAFTKDSTKIWNPVIKKTIIPQLQKVAYDTQNEIIDLNQLFVNRSDLLVDGVHPSGLGATLIAKRLYESVVRKPTEALVHLRIESNIEFDKEENFYGYALDNFTLNGIACKLARPKKAAKGMPWVFRARFWGHQPQTDIALLERGFHIAYCDVSNLFGNQEAVDRWTTFYDILVKKGLSKKVVLEGMSRGGLPIYNWAAQHPEKVACIYADAPVLDGKSWPGGMMNGKGSPDAWEAFKKMYTLDNETAIANFNGNPIHNIEAIAKGGYPMLHVCGETDEVVPIDENTVPFEKGILAHGGEITSIYKPNNGHHPHSLINPSPIVDFILRATDRKLNFAVIPAPSAEYRSAAGWAEGADWWTQASDIDSLCQAAKNADLVLIGNSITQSFGGNRPHVTVHSGKTATDTYFKGLTWINAGISGDRTQQILWRLQHGTYEKAMPKTVVLTIGVNNFPHNTTREISTGIKAVLHRVLVKFPNSKIMLFGPLPAGTDPDSSHRKKYLEVHAALKKLTPNAQVSYHEISALFVNTNGMLNPELYSSDGIHLKPEGYMVWGNYITDNSN